MRPDAHDFQLGTDKARACAHVLGAADGMTVLCGRGPLDSVHGAVTTLLPTQPDAPTRITPLRHRTPAMLSDVDNVRHEALGAYVDLGAALDAFRREAGLWLAGIAVCLAALGGGLIAMVVLYAQQATP